MRLGLPIVAIVLCGLMLPLFYRLNVVSIYEYLEDRFDARTRLLAGGLFVLLKCGYLGFVIYAPSLVLSRMLSLPLVPICIVTGIFTTFYTLAGGIKAVIWTASLQLFVLFGGALVATGIALRAVGGDGLEEVLRVAGPAGRLEVFNFSADITVTYSFWACFVGGIVNMIAQYGSDQAEVQRFLTARSARAASWALFSTMVFTVALGLMLFFIGTVLFVFYTQFPEKGGFAIHANDVFPKFIVEEMPAGLRGLMVAAVLAASMSTISSVLNSQSAVLINDYFSRVSRRSAQVRDARWLTLILGILTTALAAFGGRFGNLLDASNKLTSLFSGSLVGVFLLGMLSKSANASGAFWGVLAALATTVALDVLTNISFLWFGPASAVAAGGSGLLISRLAQARPRGSRVDHPNPPGTESDGKPD